MMPIPAVTFMHSTIHSSQNCGLPNAAFTSTSWVVIMAPAWVIEVHPDGFQPSRGTRIVNTPNIIKRK